MALIDNWVTWWTFDKLNGKDNTLNGHDLTNLSGNCFLGNSGIIRSSANTSSTNLMTAAHSAMLSFGTGAMAVSFWYKPTSAASSPLRGVINKGIGASDREYFIGHGNNIRARFYTTDASNYIGRNTNTAPMTTGVWQHIVINKPNTLVATDIEIYHNGTLQTTANDSAGTYTGMVNNSGAIYMPSADAPATATAGGNYDLFGIRSQVLTGAEVLSLYNSGAGLDLFPSPGSGGMMLQFFNQ